MSAARTDIVVLINHDRITGEVRTLNHGQLEVKTDDLGTVSIEWVKVASVTTAGRFDVAMRDGRRLLGAFGGVPAGQAGLAIVGADGQTVAVSFLDVVGFAPIRSRFFQKIDGSIDLGASYTQSSGVGQFSFNTDAVYRQPSFEASMTFSSTLTRSADSPDSARYALNIDYSLFHANGWVTRPIALLEHNPSLGFDLRGTAAATLGRFLIQSNRATVQWGAGAAVGRELPVEEAAVTNVDALGAFNASFYTYDYPKTSIDVTTSVFPALKDPGRIRVNADARLRRELLHDLFIAVTAYDSFDNRPLGTDVHQNDVGFSLSLGWAF